MNKNELLDYLESFTRGAQENLAAPADHLKRATDYVRAQIKDGHIRDRAELLTSWTSFSAGMIVGRRKSSGNDAKA